MSQILVNANETYMFPLPNSYNDLINTISTKTNINTNSISVFHNKKLLTQEVFLNFNKEKINILDVSTKLNGGSFPVFTQIVWKTITMSIILPLFGFGVLAAAAYLIEKSFKTDKKESTFDLLSHFLFFQDRSLTGI